MLNQFRFLEASLRSLMIVAGLAAPALGLWGCATTESGDASDGGGVPSPGPASSESGGPIITGSGGTYDGGGTLCVDNRCLTDGGGLSSCLDGSMSFSVRSSVSPISAPSGLGEVQPADNNCTVAVTWFEAGTDAPPDAPTISTTQTYQCPAGQVRLHVRDIWSTQANPTLGTLTGLPTVVNIHDQAAARMRSIPRRRTPPTATGIRCACRAP